MKILPCLSFWILALCAYTLAETTDPTESTDATSTTTTTSDTTSGYIVVTSETSVAVPTGDYISYATTEIVSSAELNATATSNATTSTSATDVVLVGTGSSSNSTATSTSASATNTQACNGYTEFCERKYSNITMVTAHNSPFVKKNNLAANQDYKVTRQLDDGIRMGEYSAFLIMWICAPNSKQYLSRHITMTMPSISATPPASFSTWVP